MGWRSQYRSQEPRGSEYAVGRKLFGQHANRRRAGDGPREFGRRGTVEQYAEWNRPGSKRVVHGWIRRWWRMEPRQYRNQFRKHMESASTNRRQRLSDAH